jgi:hypothetical protein
VGILYSSIWTGFFPALARISAGSPYPLVTT